MQTWIIPCFKIDPYLVPSVLYLLPDISFEPLRNYLLIHVLCVIKPKNLCLFLFWKGDHAFSVHGVLFSKKLCSPVSVSKGSLTCSLYSELFYTLLASQSYRLQLFFTVVRHSSIVISLEEVQFHAGCTTGDWQLIDSSDHMFGWTQHSLGCVQSTRCFLYVATLVAWF